MSVRIYHNPRCSKSRRTLALLSEQQLDIEVVDYLSSPPDHEELRDIIRMLKITPRGLVRDRQPEFVQLGLDADKMSDDELIDFMLRHPAVIQRPIVVNGTRACIGRPPEAVLAIL